MNNQFETSLLMNNKTNTKPIVVIGDVHGLTCWKDIVKVHKDSIFVFLGDYVLIPPVFEPFKTQ